MGLGVVGGNVGKLVGAGVGKEVGAGEGDSEGEPSGTVGFGDTGDSVGEFINDGVIEGDLDELNGFSVIGD